MNDMAMKYEDWLRGCVHHDGRKGNVYLPCDRVLAIADWIEAHRDVAPVRHERWVTTDENIGGHCSNCGMECSSVEWGDDYLMKPTWNYCPNCGAKMDENGYCHHGEREGE